MPKQSQIEKAIAAITDEIAVLILARDRLVKQQERVTLKRKTKKEIALAGKQG